MVFAHNAGLGHDHAMVQDTVLGLVRAQSADQAKLTVADGCIGSFSRRHTKAASTVWRITSRSRS